MKQPKHTPLPWEISAIDKNRILDGECRRIVKCSQHGTDNETTDEANAAFIVRACNAFYQNEAEIEALNHYSDEMKRQRDELLEALKLLTDAKAMHMHENENEYVKRSNNAMNIAYAAIAKAEGVQK